jgi:hypothetical protein
MKGKYGGKDDIMCLAIVDYDRQRKYERKIWRKG